MAGQHGRKLPRIVEAWDQFERDGINATTATPQWPAVPPRLDDSSSVVVASTVPPEWLKEPNRFSVKRFHKDKLNKSTIVGLIIVAVFCVAVVVMMKLTANCTGDISKYGLKCAGKIRNSSKADDDYYCHDPQKFGCHYISPLEEIHVHVFGELNRCNGVRLTDQMVEKIVLWDKDLFLHFGDDNLGNCVIEESGYFYCHHRGVFLIEGVSENNPPDLYFKITINDTETDFCGQGIPRCVISTREVGTVTPHRKAWKCKSPNSDVISIVTDPDLYRILDESSSLFLETSQLDNWTVWKCYVVINLDIFDNFLCEKDP